MPATATKARKGKKSTSKFLRSGYDAIRSITDKPLAQRREIPAGRHGEMVIPRKFHLNDKEIATLTAEYAENGKGYYVPNPHNRTFYHFAIESLKRLGVNRAHSVPVVIARFKDLTSAAETKDAAGKTYWQRWKNKDSAAKDDTKALSWEGKFEQNLEVLQRVPRKGSRNKHPYGLKLLESGTKVMGTKGVVIDILKGSSGQKMIMLNTNSPLPRNEFRTRGASVEQTTATAPKPKRKVVRKPKATATESAPEPVAAAA